MWSDKHEDWRAHLRIAEDSAKGLEYFEHWMQPKYLKIQLKVFALQKIYLTYHAHNVYTSFLLLNLNLTKCSLPRKLASPKEHGADCSIVHWARSLIRKGDVVSIIDPTLAIQDVKIKSMENSRSSNTMCKTTRISRAKDARNHIGHTRCNQDRNRESVYLQIYQIPIQTNVLSLSSLISYISSFHLAPL
ncbi:hypothetical protein Tco_1220242 [Tanacetum coccineum]